jgi:hypothetical protein
LQVVIVIVVVVELGVCESKDILTPYFQQYGLGHGIHIYIQRAAVQVIVLSLTLVLALMVVG